MADDDSDTTDADAPEGVFGNLPKARPGKRSPRRDGASGEPPAPRPAKAVKPLASARPAAPLPEPPTRESAPAQTAGPPSGQIKGVEDLAWAGIAVAAEAATAGVRFASRALAAARKSIDLP